MRKKSAMITIIPDEIKQKAALAMIRSGMATVGEAAHLRGVTRQYLQRAAGGLQARKARKRHLNEVWKAIIDKMS
jgi:hypothetical protein